MGWQRFNRTSRVFEVSDDNGASWQVLKIAQAGVELGGNIAYRDVDNFFVPQTLSSYSIIQGANHLLAFKDPTAGTDLKQWRFLTYGDGLMRLEALNDAGSAVTTSFNWFRNGSFNSLTIQTGGDLDVGTDANKGNLYTTFPIYPGRYDTNWTKQTTWYLAGHGGYGLYSNTGLYLQGTLTAAGNVTALGPEIRLDNGHIFCGGIIHVGMNSGLVQGVYFPRPTGGHTDAHTLDAYEEGSWTPQLQAQSGGFLGIAPQSCIYVKIGRLVFITGYFSVTSGGGAPNAGIVYIHGLPYPTANDGAVTIMMNAGVNVGGFYMPWCYHPANSSSFVLYSWIGYTITEIMSKIQNSTDFRISACYMTAS
jgi:hypothetical protein